MEDEQVGNKTINVFLAEFYNVPAIAVDTHVERVSNRLRLCSTTDNVEQVEKKLQNQFPKEKWIKLHHQLIFFGRYHCKAKKPNCDNCQIKDLCNYYQKTL